MCAIYMQTLPFGPKTVVYKGHVVALHNIDVTAKWATDKNHTKVITSEVHGNEDAAWATFDKAQMRSCLSDAFPWGAWPRDAAGHAQVSRQAKHYAHRGINALMSCDKAFQNPCHSEMRERKYVQQHIRICTHGVKTGLG